ncbi:DUF4142 domain-containing protein [Xanthomonas sp. Kuri4-2]
MKSIIVASTLTCALLLSGCGGTGEEGSRTAPATSPAPTAAPISGTGATAAVKGDAQALGVLAALDENEIALAQQAIARKLGGTTEDFAREMVTQHQADLDKVRALGVADSANAQALRAKGKAALDALAQENDENSYRNAFMATMNSDHADALKIVDAELMPAATGEAARQHLTQARKLIAEHYERAQAVVSSR